MKPPVTRRMASETRSQPATGEAGAPRRGGPRQRRAVGGSPGRRAGIARGDAAVAAARAPTLPAHLKPRARARVAPPAATPPLFAHLLRNPISGDGRRDSGCIRFGMTNV